MGSTVVKTPGPAYFQPKTILVPPYCEPCPHLHIRYEHVGLGCSFITEKARRKVKGFVECPFMLIVDRDGSFQPTMLGISHTRACDYVDPDDNQKIFWCEGGELCDFEESNGD